MEDDRFDTLSKRLAAPVSRRRILNATLASAVGGMLLRFTGNSAEAATVCRQIGESCSTTMPCCNGLCQGGICVCPRGQTPCGVGSTTGCAGCCPSPLICETTTSTCVCPSLQPPCGTNPNGTPFCCPAGKVCAKSAPGSPPACVCPDGELTCKDGSCCPPGNSTCSCPPGARCTCVCTPSCGGKQCGSDGCGGSCGTCPSGQTCSATGQCVSAACSNPAIDACFLTPHNFTCGVGGTECGCILSVEGGAYCSAFSRGECIFCAKNSNCRPDFGRDAICVRNVCCRLGTMCIDVNPPDTCVFGGCFTAETLISMADGTSRRIEHVQVGDLVLGNGGRVNRVTDVLLPVLGPRHLYSLNGGGFFVTSGHPFLTEEGWKDVDPSAVPVALSELEVGRLKVGDRLLTLKGAAVLMGGGGAASDEVVDVQVENVVLHDLRSQPFHPSTQLYDLKLDGDHTFFANDVLVHNK